MNQRNNWSLKSWLTNITVEWRLRRRPHSYNFRKVSKQRRPAARTHQHCRVLNQQMFTTKTTTATLWQAGTGCAVSMSLIYFFYFNFLSTRVSASCVNTEPLISIGCQLGLLFYLNRQDYRLTTFSIISDNCGLIFLWVPLGWVIFFCLYGVELNDLNVGLMALKSYHGGLFEYHFWSTTRCQKGELIFMTKYGTNS